MSEYPQQFASPEEFHEVFDAFMREILMHPIIGPKLARSRLVVRFEYTEPEMQITFNFREPLTEEAKAQKLHGLYVWGETPWQPEVAFRQSAAFSNRFWQGKENVIAAMAKRQVTARGSIPKALQLIPVIRPSFRIYPQVLERLGKKHLIAT